MKKKFQNKIKEKKKYVKKVSKLSISQTFYFGYLKVLLSCDTWCGVLLCYTRNHLTTQIVLVCDSLINDKFLESCFNKYLNYLLN